MLLRRYTVRAEKSPSTEDIAQIVQGKQPLPWDADGFAPVDDLKSVARDFCERFFEWKRAAEEQDLVRQEVVDSSQFYREREDRVLGLVRSVAQGQGTTEEGRLFFLLRLGEGVVDVHLRMLQLANRLDVLSKCTDVNMELLAWLQSSQAHQCVSGEPSVGGLSDDDMDDLGFVEESESESEVEDEL